VLHLLLESTVPNITAIDKTICFINKNQLTPVIELSIWFLQL